MSENERRDVKWKELLEQHYAMHVNWDLMFQVVAVFSIFLALATAMDFQLRNNVGASLTH